MIEVEADVCVCGPTVMEVLRGVRMNNQHQKIATAFENCQYLDTSRETFHHAAHIYRTCRYKGFTIRNSMDSLIAAIALEHDAELLHADRDFAAIAQYFPLKFY